MALVAAASGIVAVLPATATPRATPADLERLGTQVSQLDEELNQARIELARLDQELAEAKRAANRQHDRLAAVQRRIAARATSQYERGGLGPVAALLSGEDTTVLVQKAETLDLLAQRDGNLLDDARAVQRVFAAAAAEVARASAAQAEEVGAVTSRKAEIERKLNQLERIRSQIGDPRSVALPRGLPSASGSASAAVHTALAQLGKPYLWGASGPGAFDCSGLTSYAWAAAGTSLPHSAAAQYSSLPHVSRADLEPGDLVFFGSPIHHVGLYVGKGVMVAAPSSGRLVQVQPIDRSDYVGAARP